MSQKLEAGTFTTFTISLNSLASAAGALSDEFDNSLTANLFLWCSLQLVVGFASNPTVGQIVEAHLIPALDGTNYAEFTTGASAATQGSGTLVGSFVVARAQTAAQTLVCGAGGFSSASPLIMLPPSKFKIGLVNRATPAFAASGNTLKIQPIRTQ